MGRIGSRRRSAALLVLLATLAVGGGCRTTLPPAGAYEYFASPAPDDAWAPKIRGWQQREQRKPRAIATPDTPVPASRADVADRDATPRPPAASNAASDSRGTAAGLEHPGLERDKVGDLRSKYDAFRNQRRRGLARDVAAWIQSQARDHYVADGPVDHWATFQETFETNGDDCDGLELLTFHFLRDLGFPETEVFRAIVVRRTDGQHHMVTFWFEDENDPWVIDPTGAMTSGMPRMSEVADWVPLKVFSESSDFTVRDRMMMTATR